MRRRFCHGHAVINCFVKEFCLCSRGESSGEGPKDSPRYDFAALTSALRQYYDVCSPLSLLLDWSPKGTLPRTRQATGIAESSSDRVIQFCTRQWSAVTSSASGGKDFP